MSPVIHDGNPFVDEPDQRDPVRRFRGRLSAPVTIVTSGSPDAPAGLTVSSLLVFEGEPGRVQMILGPSSDLWDDVKTSGRFVVHICREGDSHLAEVFAGVRPSPGGPFARIDVSASDHGVTIDRLTDRIYCTSTDQREVGHTGSLTGVIDSVEVGELLDPLVYFRGHFRSLE